MSANDILWTLERPHQAQAQSPTTILVPSWPLGGRQPPEMTTASLTPQLWTEPMDEAEETLKHESVKLSPIYLEAHVGHQ